MIAKRALDNDAAWASGGPLPALKRTLDLLDLLDRADVHAEGKEALATLVKLRGAAKRDLVTTIASMDALCVDAG